MVVASMRMGLSPAGDCTHGQARARARSGLGRRSSPASPLHCDACQHAWRAAARGAAGTAALALARAASAAATGFWTSQLKPAAALWPGVCINLTLGAYTCNPLGAVQHNHGLQVRAGVKRRVNHTAGPLAIACDRGTQRRTFLSVPSHASGRAGVGSASQGPLAPHGANPS